jgi:hypothetical protein
VRAALAQPTPLPHGVRALLALGALADASGEGADLRRARRARAGAWSCDRDACAPGELAAIRLSSTRAPEGPARLVIMAVATRRGAVIVAGDRRAVGEGETEVSFALAPSRQARVVPVAVEGDARLVAVAVVGLPGPRAP